MRIGKSAGIGLLTGITMILTSLLCYHFFSSGNGQWQLLIYGIYAAGIWAGQYQFTISKDAQAGFRNLFSEGFKVFMPVTFLMVLFTWIFMKYDTNLVNQMAEAYKNKLLETGNRTLEQIETEVAQSKDKYATFFTSLAIFGYLIAGALATLSGAIFFSSRNKR
jgi:hypothetical protein